MLSVNEARERILSHFQPTATETLALATCAKRILAQEISANSDFPSFDNSSMDGFAIHAEDSNSASPTTLKVVSDIPAGTAPIHHLKRGEAARITTGAQIPQGANAVIPVEDIQASLPLMDKDLPNEISFQKQINTGENIHHDPFP